MNSSILTKKNEKKEQDKDIKNMTIFQLKEELAHQQQTLFICKFVDTNTKLRF